MRSLEFLFSILFLSVLAPLSGKTLLEREIAAGGSGTETGSILLEFFTPRETRGFRILNARNESIPVTVLSAEGGKLLVFFNAKPGEKFRLECGTEIVRNTRAEQRSGMIHYYKPYSGKTIRNPKEFLDEWKKLPPPRAAAAERVYTGMNRLGRANNSLNHYSGFIRTGTPGKINFHTASTDASFLLIDGKTIASCPGRHNVWDGVYGAFKGSADLTKGVHKFDYLHANSRWDYYAIAATSRSGAKKMNILQKDAFTKFLSAVPGKVLKGRDFSWKHTGTIDIDGKQMREIVCSDGKKFYFYTECAVMHDGYEIASSYDHSAPMVPDKRAREMIESAWNELKKGPPDENGYRFLATAIPMFKMKNIGEEFYKMIVSTGKLPAETAFKFYHVVAMDRELENERYENLARELEKWLPNNGGPARVEYAKVLFYYLGDRKKAAKILADTDPSALEGEFKRSYGLLNADIALFEKGFDEAKELYSKMDSATKKMSARQLIEAEGAMISLRNALLTGESRDAWEYLERVEKIRPDIRLNPDVMYLKARFLSRMNRPRHAAHYAEAVLKMHPSPAVASGALMMLGKQALKRSQTEEAREYFRRITEEYPRSREAFQAENMLKKEMHE